MIQGRNVHLKILEEKDLDDVFEIIKLDGIGGTFSTTYKEITRDSLPNFLFLTEKGTRAKVFGIFIKDLKAEVYVQTLIGFISLNNIHPVRHNAYIGIVGVHPEHHGGQHGLDALRTIIDYAFNTLNLHRIYGHTFGDNEKMSAIYKRGGWVHEGTEREYAYKDGEWVNRDIWGVLRDKDKWSE